MDIIGHFIRTAVSNETGVRCRACGRPIAQKDEFGRSERACRRCRGR
jgi:formamidopyrimidine-DNA glycosylase